MSTGEIVDSALRLYQRLGLTFLRISVLPALTCLASLAFVSAYVLPQLFYSQDGGNFVSHLSQVAVAISLALFVGGPLFLSGLAYTTCIVVSLVSDWTLGNPIDAEAAQEAARRSMTRLLVVGMKELLISFSGVIAAALIIVLGEWLSTVTPDSDFWSGVLVLIGTCGMLVGVIVFLAVIARDGVVAPVAVLENLGARAAGKRSRELLKPAPFHGSGTTSIWGLYCLLIFSVVVLLGGIYAFDSLLGIGEAIDAATAGVWLRPVLLRAVDLIPSFLTIWTLLPVWATTVTLLYFDRRVRLEGFDIEVLGRDLARNSRTSRLLL